MLGWIIYGLIVGALARPLSKLFFGYDEDVVVGCLPTVLLGVAGSFVGGAINYLLGFGSEPYSPSGIVMGIVGAILAAWAWTHWSSKKPE